MSEVDSARFLTNWERIEAAYLARISEVCAGATDWRDSFRSAAKETARLVEEHRAEARFIVVEAFAAGELGRERQLALIDGLAEMVDRARAELDEPERIPAATASWIVALFFDRIYRRCSSGATGPDLPSQLPELTYLAISAYFGTETGLAELIPPA